MTLTTRHFGGSVAGFEGTVVLDDATPGLAFVPSPTPLTRLNYYDGKFLRAEDLALEQLFHRRLVELSNQAGGAGLVHGFDARLESGGRLRVTSGLAVDPPGHVLLLPDDVTMSLDDLIEASTRTVIRAKRTLPRRGLPTFGPCEPARAAPVSQPTFGTELYLLTIGYVEGLCGNEEVFGRVCDEACVTATDRPYRLGGVVVRALPLRLVRPLPASTSVTLGGVHLRSRVASAFFAAEWEAGGSLLSRAGLSSNVWCAGAPELVGNDVPIAVLARTGTTVEFLDQWIARRELMETSPRRYWAGRVEMRPWDAFLAQVLQFQCQLRELGLGVPDGPTSTPDDPCGDERTLLRESAALLDTLVRAPVTAPAAPSPGVAAMALAPDAMLSIAHPGLTALRARIADALVAGPARAPRVLIDGGIVEIPPGGYLPVDPGARTPLDEQVRRLLGDGVDLRFCAVRRDQVAHELERAQHMERISLLTGLDDPARRQEVDILVPDGTVETEPRTAPGIGFAVDMALGQDAQPAFVNLTRAAALSVDRTALIRDAREDTEKLPIQGAGRVVAEPEGATRVYVAASGTVNDPAARMALMRLAARLAGDSGNLSERLADVPPIDDADPEHRELEVLADEVGRAAAVRRARRDVPRLISVERTDEPMPIQLWTTFEIERDPFDVVEGTPIPVHASLDAYSPSQPAIGVRHDVVGRVQVGRRQFVEGREVIEARFTGSLESQTGGLRGLRQPSGRVSFDLELHRGVVEGGPAVLIRFMDGRESNLALGVRWSGSPLRADVRLYEGPMAVREMFVRGAVGGRALLEEDPTILDEGNRRHQLAKKTLAVLQGWYPGDPGFLERSLALLFPRPKPGVVRVRPTLDWVLFRRRRREECSDVTVQPVAPPGRVAMWVTEQKTQAVARRVAKSVHLGDTTGLEWTSLGEVEFEAGTAKRLTPAADLEQRWLADHAGTGVVFVGHARNGEGPDVLGAARAQSVVEALAQVAELDEGAPVDIIGDPPEDRLVAGTEGSLLFVVYPKEVPVVRPDCVAALVARDVDSGNGQKLRAAVLQGDLGNYLVFERMVDRVGEVPFPEGSLDGEATVHLEETLKGIEIELAEGEGGQRYPEHVVWIAAGFEERQPGRGEAMARELAERLGREIEVILPVPFDPGDDCPVRFYVLERLG